MNCVHPGWGFVLRSYASVHVDHMYAIWSVFFHSPVGAVQDNAWITPSEGDCGTVRNKWECAFLPSSNCSLPLEVTDCDHKHCNDYSNAWLSTVFSRADPDGKSLSPHAREVINALGKEPITEEQRRLTSLAALAGPPSFLQASSPSSASFAPDPTLDHDELMADPSAAIFALAFLLRQNAFYRSEVARLLSGSILLHEEEAPEGECVVAHLRRGDRLVVGADPREYCANMTAGRLCRGADGSLGKCDEHMGCREGVPFSLVGIEHVLEKVPLLLGEKVRRVLLLSDDDGWLHEQIEGFRAAQLRGEVAKDWELLALPPMAIRNGHGHADGPNLVAEPFEGYNFLRFQGGTASGVRYMASLELATKCKALVGHFSSGATRLYYRYMCLHHAGLQGVCPPAYDFRRGLWADDFVA